MSPPHGVLFDFSGTLFDDTSALPVDMLVERAARRGRCVSLSEAARLRAAVLQQADSPAGVAARRHSDLSSSGHRAAWQDVTSLVPDIDAVLGAVFYECLTAVDGWQPYPDVAPVLTALTARGVPVGVVSNTGWDIRGSFTAAGITDLVNTFVLSYEVGIKKPDPEIFRIACQQLGTEPGDTLLVGDDPACDAPAVRAGLPVHLLPATRGPTMPRGLRTAVAALLGGVIRD